MECNEMTKLIENHPNLNFCVQLEISKINLKGGIFKNQDSKKNFQPFLIRFKSTNNQTDKIDIKSEEDLDKTKEKLISFNVKASLLSTTKIAITVVQTTLIVLETNICNTVISLPPINFMDEENKALYNLLNNDQELVMQMSIKINVEASDETGCVKKKNFSSNFNYFSNISNDTSKVSVKNTDSSFDRIILNYNKKNLYSSHHQTDKRQNNENNIITDKPYITEDNEKNDKYNNKNSINFHNLNTSIIKGDEINNQNMSVLFEQQQLFTLLNDDERKDQKEKLFKMKEKYNALKEDKEILYKEFDKVEKQKESIFFI